MAIVDLYKVIWHNSRHNNANQQTNSDFVVAAANSKAETLPSTIQTNNGDGKTVTVENIVVVQKGIIQ
jgi:hypothetical protein